MEIILWLPHLDHVIQERIRDFFEPVRHAGGDDDHVALIEPARFTTVDGLAAEFIGSSVLELTAVPPVMRVAVPSST